MGQRYPHGKLTSTPHSNERTFGEKPMWATTSLIDAMRTAKKGITLSNRWCIPLMLDYYIRFGLTCQGFIFSFFTFLFSLDLCKSLVIGWVMPYVCHNEYVYSEYLRVCYTYSYSFDPQSHYTDLYKCCQGLIWCALKSVWNITEASENASTAFIVLWCMC